MRKESEENEEIGVIVLWQDREFVPQNSSCARRAGYGRSCKGRAKDDRALAQRSKEPTFLKRAGMKP